MLVLQGNGGPLSFVKQRATNSPGPLALLYPCAQDTPSGLAVCRVSLAFPQIRTDRRKVGFAQQPPYLLRLSPA